MAGKRTETDLEVLGNTLLVRRDGKKLQTSGGILLSDNHTPKPATGTVLKVGKGLPGPHGLIAPDVEPGDWIMFDYNAGREFDHKGETFLIMDTTQVMVRRPAASVAADKAGDETAAAESEAVSDHREAAQDSDADPAVHVHGWRLGQRTQ
jgi:co-chaperonin GroES (HSP10)